MLQQHLETCESCRSTFGALLAVADALPLQVEELAPPAGFRDRLLAQVQPEAIRSLPNDRAQSTPAPVFIPDHQAAMTAPPASTTKPTLNWAIWGALAAAVLILAVLSGVAVDRLVLQEDEPEAETIALQYLADVQSEQGVLEYLPEQDVLHFHAPDLPPPPADHVYQAWLIDDAGPRPVGVIDPDTGELATTVNRERDTTFAITVEPAPLGSAGPTTDPVIVAPLDDES